MGLQKNDLLQQKELEYLRVGFLTYYLLKTIQELPSVGMEPYYALVAQVIESKNKLGAGKSLLFKRISWLVEQECLTVKQGLSSNPKAKKKVNYFYITPKGKLLLKNLEKESLRILN